MSDHEPITVATVGHSTRSIEELAALLTESRVHEVADIRTVPKSRHNPQFHVDRLADELSPYGLAYRHVPELGGWRRGFAESPNGAWRNTSFRNYADYMQTEEFAAAVADLLTKARRTPTALMCSEAVPWRCHRRLVADALLVRGAIVRHIMGPGQVREATLTPFAKVDGVSITYPPVT